MEANPTDGCVSVDNANTSLRRISGRVHVTSRVSKLAIETDRLAFGVI
jgi:hypothetical protein